MKQFCLVSVCHQLISKMGPFNLAVTGQQIINPRLEQVCSYINFVIPILVALARFSSPEPEPP